MGWVQIDWEWRWWVAGDQGGEGVEATSSGCRWWPWQWARSGCPVVVKVVVVAGKAGRLLAHLFSHGRGTRWWGLPGDRCDIRVMSCLGVDQWVCMGQVLGGLGGEVGGCLSPMSSPESGVWWGRWWGLDVSRQRVGGIGGWEWTTAWPRQKADLVQWDQDGLTRGWAQSAELVGQSMVMWCVWEVDSSTTEDGGVGDGGEMLRWSAVGR